MALIKPEEYLPVFPKYKQNGAKCMFPRESRDVIFSQFLPMT